MTKQAYLDRLEALTQELLNSYSEEEDAFTLRSVAEVYLKVLNEHGPATLSRTFMRSYGQYYDEDVLSVARAMELVRQQN